MSLSHVPAGDWWCSCGEQAGVSQTSPPLEEEEIEEEEYLEVELVRSHRRSKKAENSLSDNKKSW